MANTIWSMIKEFIIVYISEHGLDIIKKVVIATFVFILFYILISLLVKKVESKIIDSDIQTHNTYTNKLANLVWKIIYTIWLIFNLLILCEILWINVSLLMAWISLWLWFAMETMIWNIISWVFILTNKKFKIWDFVEILWNINTRGTIEEINLKHTIIRCIDKRKLLIPNSVMASTTMKTLKTEKLIRWDLEILLPRHVNVEQVKSLINEATNNYENTEHKEYTNTFIENFDNNWYKFHTIFFFDPKKCTAMVAWSAIRIELSKIFKKYWISNPYKHLNISIQE